MSKSNDTNSPNDSQSKQMSLWTDDTQDMRPLPELIAEQYGFALAYHDVDDVRHYAVQDWIKGVAQTDNPRQVWADIKRRYDPKNVDYSARQSKRGRKRISKDEAESVQNQLSNLVQQLPYKAANGKTYQMDHASAEALYLITQLMDAETGLRNKVLAYLAKAGVLLDEIRTNPDAAAQLVDNLQTRHQLTRAKGIEKRNLLTKTAQETHITHQPDYVALTNAEYGVLFGAAKHELVKVLGLTKTQAARFRDHISTLALTALDMAETAAAMRMDQLARRLTTDEQIEIVLHAARIVAPTVNELADYLSVDLLSGKPLLKSGK